MHQRNCFIIRSYYTLMCTCSECVDVVNNVVHAAMSGIPRQVPFMFQTVQHELVVLLIGFCLKFFTSRIDCSFCLQKLHTKTKNYVQFFWCGFTDFILTTLIFISVDMSFDSLLQSFSYKLSKIYYYSLFRES